MCTQCFPLWYKANPCTQHHLNTYTHNDSIYINYEIQNVLTLLQSWKICNSALNPYLSKPTSPFDIPIWIYCPSAILDSNWIPLLTLSQKPPSSSSTLPPWTFQLYILSPIHHPPNTYPPAPFSSYNIQYLYQLRNVATLNHNTFPIVHVPRFISISINIPILCTCTAGSTCKYLLDLHLIVI